MAKLEIEGMDDLISDFMKIADLPEAVQMEMLHSEADIVVKTQKEQIDSMGLRDTGHLRESIARKRGAGVSLDIFPQGTRDDGVRNAEVGFIHEFGAPGRRIKASGWMEKANEACADEAAMAAEEVYNKFLDNNNL